VDATPPTTPLSEQRPPNPESLPRICPDCPGRHLWRPYLESLGLNGLYNMGNRLRGHETARIGPSSWYANMKHGFEWDNNPFGVNQIGHPYQGSNYFTAGRANGLSFWESTAVAAFGSAAWEFYFENNRASLNDLINTTLGGIALGEVMHRTAWLVRRPKATGKGRVTREIIATAIDPVGGATRFASGEASRIGEPPANLMPSSLGWRAAGGTLWQGSNVWSPGGAFLPFVSFDLRYGEIAAGASRFPYDAFTVGVTMGGGDAVSEAVARGRFYSKAFGAHGQYQFTVLQTFDYLVNRAYRFGGQGFDGELAMTRRWSGTTLRLSASSGASVLGAVDSLLPAPPEAGDPDAPFSNPESRRYDYGPGFRVEGAAHLAVDRRIDATLSYYLYHVAVVDGFRSNQVLQRAHLDVQWQPARRVGLGFATEYFFRKAYFWAAGDRRDRSPQFRVYVAWVEP
jgi:hypothetical protein